MIGEDLWRCGRTSPIDPTRSAIIAKWSYRQRRKRRRRRKGRTSRGAAGSWPCFGASLGTRSVVPVQPRRCPCSIWAQEHGTTRPCRNSTLRPRSHRPRRHRTHRRKHLECIFKQRIWRPPGEEAAIDCWHRSSLAGDAVEVWAPGATCPGHPSGWTKGSFISVSDVAPILAIMTSLYFINQRLTFRWTILIQH